MIEYLDGLGYIGLFIGSFLASTLIPMSADALLIGMLAIGGEAYLCVGIATLGNWLGGMTSYSIGWIGKWEWIEKWLKVSKEKLYRQKEKIDRFGVLLALFTWLPIVGDLFAIAFGFYKINPIASSIYMFIGRLFRFLVWLLIYKQF